MIVPAIPNLNCCSKHRLIPPEPIKQAKSIIVSSNSNPLMETYSIIISMIQEEIIFRKTFSLISLKIISVYLRQQFLKPPRLNYRRSPHSSRLIISFRTRIVNQIPIIDLYFPKTTRHSKPQVLIKILLIILTMEIL